MKSVVLFGAGASRACENLDPVPPLGDQLFKALEDQGAASNIPNDIKSIFHADGFEKGMAALSENHFHLVPRLNCEIAVYLLNIAVKGLTPYHYLVDAMGYQSRNILWSTINYDCILEQAISKISGGFRYFPKTPDEYPQVMKLHGSANFRIPDCHEFNIRNLLSLQSKPQTFQMVDTQWEPILNIGEAISKWEDLEEGLGPAMALYMEGKYNLMSRTAFRNQLSNWASAIENCESIVVIGARYVDHDKHIWEPILKSKAKIGFVDPNPDTSSLALIKAGRSGVCHLANSFDRASCTAMKNFIFNS